MRLGTALTILAIALAAAIGTATAKDVAIPVPSGPTLKLQGLITPKALARGKPTPATLTLNARIGTTDGSRPAALKQLTLDLDRHIVLDRRGFPVCRGGGRDIRSSQPWAGCEDAIVGRGRIGFEVQFPGQASISTASELRVLNVSAANGGATLIAVALIKQPITIGIAMPIALAKLPGGGSRLVLDVPEIANGAGSLTMLRIQLGKRIAAAGTVRNLVAASCPDGRLTADVTAEFADSTTTYLQLLQACTGLRLSRK